MVGEPTAGFLQGLVTNDVDLLVAGEAASIYTFFLNSKGKVLFDTHIYSHGAPDDHAFLIDCDVAVADALMRHLLRYKVRAKIKITDATERFAVCVSSEGGAGTDLGMDKSCLVAGGPDTRFPPSLPAVARVIADRGAAPAPDPELESAYGAFRLTAGVGEGADDFPYDGCFPLESNLDFVGGVSFSKGCYLGQELTARTYHTGVTRKRLVPVTLAVPDGGPLPDGAALAALLAGDGAVLKTTKGKLGGRLRSVSPDGVGLAQLRLRYLQDDLLAGNGAVAITASVPDWWPEIDGVNG